MNFDLQPHHVARLLFVLCVVPVLWVFAVQGVTTTTSYDLSTGDVSSTSDLGSQIVKVLIFVILAAIFGAAEWYTRKNSTAWLPAIREKLISVGLSRPDTPNRDLRDDRGYHQPYP
ncbi:hypothetical protein FK535_06935 [Mycolicibacterium sp. 018/SC-01/001]|uniref:hypothetical protein n=1 Tax=Mycolicibacterium sp. 018/SC-01/001 TaxID=2592069 RepID=UPI00117EEB18|nr:hypothetical protein [Mycolicibacterium sp. 018/SC-01/001]TRW86202.1 hypothetical protein FK535_06935 [Mycolicibacterium sp. 018/SC-01/001]